ncbi:MAG: hypothetical protein EOO46_23140 [Flavobacterium sp.]|nr:MAG: hypothetical protein EOO46_23140 [Flavobacterium sp.]
MKVEVILNIYMYAVFAGGAIYVFYTQKKFRQIFRKYTDQPHWLRQMTVKDLSAADKAKVNDLHWQRTAVIIMIGILLIFGSILKGIAT